MYNFLFTFLNVNMYTHHIYGDFQTVVIIRHIYLYRNVGAFRRA